MEAPSTQMQSTTRVSGSLHDILCDSRPSGPVAIRPHRFVVAWHGVLALAFEAWPTPLVKIKKRIIGNNAPEFPSSAENFGTRWPKATLGALRDDAPPMTLDELRDLTALCREFDVALRDLGSVPLSQCSLVMFASRSLDHCLCRLDYAFARGESSSTSARKDNEEEEEEEEYDADSHEIVRNVVSETERDLDKYIEKVNAPGHRWGEHYNAIWTEATLVCFLADNGGDEVTMSPSASRLLAIIASFRERVDALLPGAYTWMGKKSLHLSLLALDNRSNVPRAV